MTIPAGVTEIGEWAFSGCTGLTNVTIPAGVTEIGEWAFQGCTGLASVTIPAGVTEIGEWAFQGCTGLISVTIPEGVTKIGHFAFKDCTGLTGVTVPESVTEIGGCAFRGCTALKSVMFLGEPEIGEEAFPDSIVSIVAERLRMGAYPIPAYKWAAARGFALRYGSGETLPEAYRADCLKYIKGQKKKLYPMALQFPALLHVMLEEKMVPKGDLPDLIEEATSLNRPEVTAMLLDYQDKQLKPGEREKQEEKKRQREMDFLLTGALTATEAKKSWRYEKDEKGNLTILGYKGKEADVEVPAVIGKDPVTAIGGGAFSPKASRLTEVQREQRRQIVSITLPETITTIGKWAFRDCTGLTSVTIPASAKKIDRSAFQGCEYLTIHAPAGSYAEQYAKKCNIPFAAE